ncbi:hypothetical protein SAMN02745146_2130 [Hymenobacter daecheongensis DSM 21074]|uniref:Uncharacterized protein n=1 Tax=Hymenobacter daecheongensis DSM 21074 TaxID=1121955 RepID=A0A1M6G5W7_9BACT|nr:hypothetical protein [Hymenobacter daecheongensis]SHJ05313.1 hypothetical protein SAMN02745146_2130 [Hymenobacter daecheongensis DSM 21074]
MPAADIVWWANLAKKLNILALLTFLVPLAVGLWRWRRLAVAHRPLVWFALGPGCVLGLASEIGRYVFRNNIAPLRLTVLAETLVLGWAYWYALDSPRTRLFLLGALGVFGLVFVAESVYWHGFWRGENAYAHTVQTFVLLSFALLYFEHLLRELHTIRLEHDPMFLISVGVMLYYAGTLMIFLLENSMQRLHQIDEIWTMYIIQAVLLMVFNGFLTLALWNANRPARPAS